MHHEQCNNPSWMQIQEMIMASVSGALNRLLCMPSMHSRNAYWTRRLRRRYRFGLFRCACCLLELPELAGEIGGDGAHAVDPGFGFGGAVVVGIRVDVVGVELAGVVGDEFDAGDDDAVVGDEAPVALKNRKAEIAHDADPRPRGRRYVAYWAKCIVNLT